MLLPQVSEITQFTDDLSKSFTDGDPNNSFFIPTQAFQNPLFKSAMPYFFSGDGKVTRMVVTPEREGFSQEAMELSSKIIPTALQAIKGTSWRAAPSASADRVARC